MPKDYKCCVCRKYHVKDRRPIQVPALNKYVAKLICRDVQDDDILCNKCRAIYYRKQRCNKNDKPTVIEHDDCSDDEDDTYTDESDDNDDHFITN